MNQFSDSDSNDSDQGIRYKTDSTRNKNLSSRTHTRRSRSRSRSPNARPKRRNDVGPQLPPPLLKKDSPQKSHIGPQLPPHSPKIEDSIEEYSSIGPQLPPHLQKKAEAIIEEPPKESSSIGPQLPPHLQNKTQGSSSSYGPQLPPHLLKTQDPPGIGPQLPPHLRQQLQEQAPDEESDEEMYGPLPVGASISSGGQLALEERALQLKMDQLEPNQDRAPVREEWMIELPEVKAAKFGLGPRQFRSKAGPDMSDRSSWTDTPDKKTKKSDKVDLKKEAELKQIQTRDDQQEKIAKKLKKKNKESLLEMHQSKMGEKKKEEGSERRPFSRETDLQVNRFDEAQKKAVLKKAQLLDDRFSRGQSKFL